MSKEDPASDERPSSRSGKHALDWLVVGSLFLAVVGVGCWFGLRQIEQRTRANVGDSLSVVVNSTQDSLREWFRSERDFALQLADHPEVMVATQELLATPRTAEALRGHSAFRDLRNFFEARVSSQMKSGIFLISPDEVSLFSMRDANVGTRSLIAEQRPNLLRPAFEGEGRMLSDSRFDRNLVDCQITPP